MSVINRLEISNCLNLDNFLPSQTKWAPHYPYLEINFRGLSSAIKATNGTGKTTINNAYYALTTRDRLMTRKFISRMAPKRKGIWSHFRLEMLYKTPQDMLDPGLFGKDIAGEPWVFGIYGYSDGDVLFYCYQRHFEDCPLATKDGHQHELVQNETFFETFKPLPDAIIPNTVSDWKKRIGRHIDESWIESNPGRPPRSPHHQQGFARPAVVWFGELLPAGAMERATAAALACDVCFSIGTSSLVQPAASLPFAALRSGAAVVEINPSPTALSDLADFSLQATAATALTAISAALTRAK